jgi:hypothetical protein
VSHRGIEANPTKI